MPTKKKKCAEEVEEKVMETAEETENSECGEEKPAQEEVDENAALIEKLTSERDEYINALKRERADFENYKKRNADLVARTHFEGVFDTVKAILPVLDNLERAADAAAEDDPLKQGIDLVLKSMRTELEKLGVKEIDTSGAFDPNFHNAVMQVAPDDGDVSGTVKETFQKGYMLKDKVLRYSMVKVVQ